LRSRARFVPATVYFRLPYVAEDDICLDAEAALAAGAELAGGGKDFYFSDAWRVLEERTGGVATGPFVSRSTYGGAGVAGLDWFHQTAVPVLNRDVRGGGTIDGDRVTVTFSTQSKPGSGPWGGRWGRTLVLTRQRSVDER
jgi:hypothetical protein